MTFTIYLAHKWNFNNKLFYQTKTEWINWYTSQGHSKEQIKKWTNDFMLIKIGETSNLTNRRKNLGRPVKHFFEFEGTYADALFLESYLRATIEHHYKQNCQHCGNDHFYCINTNIIRSIDKNFDKWCADGYQLLQKLA